MKFPQLRLAPFEAAIAAIVVVQAVVAFGEWGLVDPVAELLPDWLRLAFNAAYLLAGLAILAGLLCPRGDVEAAGLMLLSWTIIARGIMFGYLLGWGVQSVTSLAFSGGVLWASLTRISTIRKLASGGR